MGAVVVIGVDLPHNATNTPELVMQKFHEKTAAWRRAADREAYNAKARDYRQRRAA